MDHQEEEAPAALPEPAVPDFVPSLAQCCVHALGGVREYLGDLGHAVLPHQLRRILASATRTQLQTVEDLTRDGSERDLTWYTWHLWQRVFVALFGQPAAGQLAALPGDAPVDYEPPPGVKAPPADYRAMVEAREAAAAERMAAAQQRLRRNYHQAGQDRQSHGVEYTNKLPPPKRSRLMSGAAAAQRQAAGGSSGGSSGGGGSRLLGGRPATKMMNDLGLGPNKKPRTNSSLDLKRKAQAQLQLQQKQKQQRLAGPVAALGSSNRTAAGAAAALPVRKAGGSSSSSGALGRPGSLAGAQQRQQQGRAGISLGAASGSATKPSVKSGSSAAAGRSSAVMTSLASSSGSSKPASAVCQQRQLEAAQQRQQRQQQQAKAGLGLLDRPVLLPSAAGRR